MPVTDFDSYLPWQSQIHAILDERFYPKAWFDGEVWSGRIKCWASDDAVILATIKKYPSGAKELHGCAAAGAVGAILELIKCAENWGRKEGCIVAVIESREGWAKALEPDGYRLFQTSIRKELC